MYIVDWSSWGSPVGIALFLVGLSLSFYLFSLAVRNIDTIDTRRKQGK